MILTLTFGKSCKDGCGVNIIGLPKSGGRIIFLNLRSIFGVFTIKYNIIVDKANIRDLNSNCS